MEIMRNFIYIFIFTALGACSKLDKKSVSIQKDVDGFHSIELNDVFDVTLVEDSVFYVEIIGVPKMVEGVEVVCTDSVLFLNRKNGNRWYRPATNEVKVIIHSKPLKLVVANQTCFIGTSRPITSDEFGLVFKGKSSLGDLELNCNSFYFWNNEPTGGLLTIRGKSNFFQIWNAAIMSVDAKDLETEYGLIENYSKGDCSIRATNTFEYAITGTGNIDLYGSPGLIVQKQLTGTGRLIEH